MRNLLMRNGTFFVSENHNPEDAVAFCAARAFFTTRSEYFQNQRISLIWLWT
jgi:hypothetical protein